MTELMRGTLVGVGGVTLLSAIPSACLFLAFRRITARHSVPKKMAGFLGLLCGAVMAGLIIGKGGERLNPSYGSFVILFLILFSSSGFLTSWEWGWRAFLWPPAIATVDSALCRFLHPDPVFGGVSFLFIFITLATYTGYCFGFYFRRRHGVPNLPLEQPAAIGKPL